MRKHELDQTWLPESIDPYLEQQLTAIEGRLRSKGTPAHYNSFINDLELSQAGQILAIKNLSVHWDEFVTRKKRLESEVAKGGYRGLTAKERFYWKAENRLTDLMVDLANYAVACSWFYEYRRENLPAGQEGGLAKLKTGFDFQRLSDPDFDGDHVGRTLECLRNQYLERHADKDPAISSASQDYYRDELDQLYFRDTVIGCNLALMGKIVRYQGSCFTGNREINHILMPSLLYKQSLLTTVCGLKVKQAYRQLAGL